MRKREGTIAFLFSFNLLAKKSSSLAGIYSKEIE
jgi:hypothetical protein